jgi:hypothetical protein
MNEWNWLLFPCRTIGESKGDNSLGFQLYQVGSQGAKEIKWTQQTEDSLQLDWSTKGRYIHDLSSRVMPACDLDLKINRQMIHRFCSRS